MSDCQRCEMLESLVRLLTFERDTYAACLADVEEQADALSEQLDDLEKEMGR